VGNTFDAWLRGHYPGTACDRIISAYSSRRGADLSVSAEPLPLSPRGTSEETTTARERRTCRNRAAPVAWSASSARRGVAGLVHEVERCNLDLWRQNGEGEGEERGEKFEKVTVHMAACRRCSARASESKREEKGNSMLVP